MSKAIEVSRNSCALHGALQTLQAIAGVSPIVHANAGCGIQQYFGSARASGGGSSSAFGGLALPSSNVIEKQVVFGGTSRLREQIKNTVRLLAADLYVVIGGCTTELVGDDIPAMAKEASDQGYPVIHLASPGFRGDVYKGYQLAVKGILEQLPKIVKVSHEKQKGLVNIFGIVPGQDIFWEGNLAAIKKLLEKLGLTVNTLFGYGQGIEEWKKVYQAELNIVFSPWGDEIAEHVAQKHEIPFVSFPYLPIGDEESFHFLQGVAAKIHLDEKKLHRLQAEEERRFSYHLQKIADVYFANGFQRKFALVGDSVSGIGLLKFLTDTMGLVPQALIFTNNLTDEQQAALGGIVEKLVDSSAIAFAEDAGKIEDILSTSDVELIIGSSIEKRIAGELQLPILPLFFPVYERIVLNQSFVGYDGAITLLEDLGSLLSQKVVG